MYYHFHMCTKNYDHGIPHTWCMTDGWIDRRKKRHIEVGAPPKNNNRTSEMQGAERKERSTIG